MQLVTIRHSAWAAVCVAIVCATPATAETISRYRNLVLSHNPVAYWRLGEASGATAFDETGVYQGVYSGPLLGQAGGVWKNTAAYFDGVNDYVDVGSPTVSGSALTLTAWIKANAFPARDFRLLSKKKIWTVLLVVANAGSLSTQEVNRKNLMESWGYQVNTISDHDTQTNFNAAVALADATYVSSTVSATSLGTKLKSATIGVLNEKLELMDDFGIAGSVMYKSRNSVRVVNNSHYISNAAPVGDTIYLTNTLQEFNLLNSSLAPGLLVLTKTNNVGATYKDSLSVLNPGASLYGGGTAAGRRVAMPWGDSAFDVGSLNVYGQLAMQLCIEWAMGKDAASAENNRHWWTLGGAYSGGATYLDVYLKTGSSTVRLTDASSPLTPGAWVFAAAVYNGATLKLYKNAVEVASITRTGSLDATSGVPVWIGDQPERVAGSALGKPALGDIDEVAIFGSALSATQLQELYEARSRPRIKVCKWIELP